VEQSPQLVELFRRAEVGGLDDLVELLRERLVVELVGESIRVRAGGRLVGRLVAGIVGRFLVHILQFGFGALDLARFLGRAGGLVLLGVGVFAFALALLGRLVGFLALFGLLVVPALLAVTRIVVEFAVGHEIQVAQQPSRRFGEVVLVLEA